MNISEVKRNLERTVLYNGAEYILKGCIIKDGTSVILVGIHLMLPENGMEAKGDFGKKHSPVNAGVQKCAIQRVL